MGVRSLRLPLVLLAIFVRSNAYAMGPRVWLCAGSVLPDGSRVVAPSTLNGMFSALSTSFDLLGRTGDWDETSRTGNPIRCKDITLYKTGYSNGLAARGYEEGSAVEWREGEVYALINGLDRQATSKLFESQEHMDAGRRSRALRAMQDALLLDRDAMVASYLWFGMQRGKEAGALTLEDLCQPDGALLLQPLPYPVPHGFQVGMPRRLLPPRAPLLLILYWALLLALLSVTPCIKMFWPALLCRPVAWPVIPAAALGLDTGCH